MEVETLAVLGTGEGRRALDAAERAGGDPLTAAAALRSAGFPAELAAAALTQVELRRRAIAKFGPDAAGMFFTRDGLEQATRARVADRRAARLAASGARSVADLGCGVGADAFAFARAGLRVEAVDVDPLTAAVAAANAARLQLSRLVRVSAADASTVDLSTVDAVFCDPARRSGNRRVFDPRAYSPPWDFVAALPARVPRTVWKLAPGIDHALIPPDAEAEWVSVDGDVVETTVWCGPLASVPRRATALRDGTESSLTGTGLRQADVGPVRRYAFDPDGAVVRSHLVAEFADTVGGTLADSRIAYVFADAPARTPFARCFEVLERFPCGVKRVRAEMRAAGIGVLEILKRGIPIDPNQFRRELRLSGPESASMILTRVDGEPAALLCRPV